MCFRTGQLSIAKVAFEEKSVRNDLEYNAYVVRRSPDLALASTEGPK